MKIAVDIRSLQSGQISGVENYTQNLLENLLAIDKENFYVLFYNSITSKNFEQLHFINSEIVNFRWSNKILNLSLDLLSKPDLSEALGKPDLIFYPNINHYSASWAKNSVLTVHDFSAFVKPELFDFRRRLWHKSVAMREKLHQAKKIIAVSEYTKLDCLNLFGVPESKVSVIYPGIDLKIPDFTEQKLRALRNVYSLPLDYILFVGTLEPRKNILGLIDSFETLKSNAHLVLAGKLGWKYSEILKKIKNSPKAHMIHYLGYVPETDKAGIIQLARMVAYPSFYEGFGFVPLEAFKFGIPVLTTGLTSLPEVVSDAALLVDPYNTNMLAQGLNSLLTDEPLRQMLIKKGFNTLIRYEWRKSALRHLALFQAIT